MGFSLLPKEYVFFDMFDSLAEQCIVASKQFQENMNKASFTEEDVKKIKDTEHAADKIVFDTLEKLNKTFITPFDREDIHELIHEMDSVIDLILKLANMMKIYKITKIDKKFVEEFNLIEKSIEALTKAVHGLRNLKDTKATMQYIAEINKLESKGDKLRNEFVADLFSENTDAIYIMKWKDIIQTSEKLIDQCDDVAKIVESIIVKQA